MTKLRVAIIGAGPAGIYAADILRKTERVGEVSIDLFDHLPAPYGLVRYAVAPDHPRIKGIVNALREIIDRRDIRIFCNVRYGVDITLEDIRQHYNVVLFATGAAKDAPLDIPGIDLKGSFGAADFVSWFDGHPDVPRTWPLSASQIAVIGNGNVALDISRILAKPADALLSTEIPDNVYEGLKSSSVSDVHIFGRRGPTQVKFTPLELRELGEIEGVDMVVYDEDFDYTEKDHETIVRNKQVMVIDRILQQWRTRQKSDANRRIHLHFFSKPLELISDVNGNVSQLRYERMLPDEAGGVVPSGEIRQIEIQAFYRAVGYFGSQLRDIPFDETHGIIPNHEGQVLQQDSNERMYGVYCTGWIKRGPVGLIGHTKSDAMETIRHVFNDQANWWTPQYPDEASVDALLNARKIDYVTLDGWHRIDQYEMQLGSQRGRERVKVVAREDMVDITRGHLPQAIHSEEKGTG